MASRVEIVGTKPKRIGIVDQPKRRVNAEGLAAALGANPGGQEVRGTFDFIGLAEIGTQLLNRLRSRGGRPALPDATTNCRVPLTAEDVMALESIVANIGVSKGIKPSVGQLISVLVNNYLGTQASGANTSIDLDRAAIETGALALEWAKLFPNVSHLDEVAACAKSVAQRGMPLMTARAA